MNRYPLWKNLLILFLVVLSIVIALPNLYGEDPAIQVTATRNAANNAALESKVRARLATAKVGYIGIEPALQGVVVRFSDAESQIRARDFLESDLAPDYSVTLSLAPASPHWLRAIGINPMFLGLDLRGGIHFLLEIDMPAVIEMTEERLVNDLRSFLRENNIRYQNVRRYHDIGIRIGFLDHNQLENAKPLIAREFPNLTFRSPDDPSNALQLSIRPAVLAETQKLALKQNLAILRNRVDELGVSEPIVQQQGKDRVVVQLPGGRCERSNF